ncbi:MAG: HAMP domain-containing histidine kinase [Lachnospiraceae bacterium]|nr:HAMP domain-containing histidine kinase [Lachnospiraceae bacterium]
MNKRKTFSKVFTGKLLISIPLILFIILITIYVLSQYSKSILSETLAYSTRNYVDKVLDSQQDKTFEENYNYLKFRTNLIFETTVCRFPGLKAYMYVTDPDGKTVIDTSPAWSLLVSIRDEDMNVVDRKVYLCDYESLCRFDEVREVISEYNSVYDVSFLDFIIPGKKTYKYIEILEGYVDPDTLKVYPTTVEITTERIPDWMGMYEDTGDVVIDKQMISMPLNNTEGLLTYKYDTETYEFFIDSEKVTGIHILTGRDLDLNDYQEVSRRPFSHHMTNEEYYTDADGKEFVIVTKITDDFLRTFLSFIILLSFIYVLIDIVVCFVLSNISYSKLKVFYQNEDYRKALMNSMAHDLKTPLTVMSGYAENLKENVQTEKREHYADSILENTAYMNGIISDVLELSKVEDSKSKDSFEKLDFCEIAKETGDRYSQAMKDKNLTLDVKGSFIRKANKKGIERVLDNIIGNAVKYTSEGGTIKIYAKDTPFSRHSMIIENTPIVPLTVKADRLWEPFVKDDSSRSENNGTGLGLSIVRNILSSYGFRAKIKSQNNDFKIIIK